MSSTTGSLSAGNPVILSYPFNVFNGVATGIGKAIFPLKEESDDLLFYIKNIYILPKVASVKCPGANYSF